MNDASAQCIPCRKGDPGLGPEEARQALADLPGWELTPDGKTLTRRFTFGNYAQALAWVLRVSELAEMQNHHPDIAFGWGYAQIAFTTHAIGGLHRNDVIMAARLNALDKTNA